MSVLLVLLTLANVGLWSLLAGSRWGSLLAVPAVGAATALLIVVTLVVTPFVPVPMGLVVVGVLVASTAVAVVVAAKGRRVVRPGPGALALWLPASLGAVVWIAVRVAATLTPGASQVSWALEGDATNNMNYIARLLVDNGIRLGGTENPVPLPVGAVAIPLSLEHLVSSQPSTLAADLSSYGWVWTALLGVGCVVMGVICASLVDRRRRVLVAVASAAGSLLPLTWFIGGLPIEYGYFNMPFALALALASWLVFVAAERSPVVAVTTEVALATLLLITWSPILLIPVALGLVLAVRHRRMLVVARGSGLATLVAAVALALGLAGSLTIPAFSVQSTALTASGQGFPASWVLVFALVAASLVAAAHLRTRSAAPVFPGALALVAASYAALALMLHFSRDVFDPWTAYYTVKMLWLVTALWVPVALSLVLAVAATVRPRALALPAVAVVAVGGVLLAAHAPVTGHPGQAVRQPAERILGGNDWATGDAAVRGIAQIAQRGESAFLWQSLSPDEQVINFWAAFAVGDQEAVDRAPKRFAFREYSAFRGGNDSGPASYNALCGLLRDPARSIVVYTDNPLLEAEFTENCTGASADFRVGQTPGVAYGGSSAD